MQASSDELAAECERVGRQRLAEFRKLDSCPDLSTLQTQQRQFDLSWKPTDCRSKRQYQGWTGVEWPSNMFNPAELQIAGQHVHQHQHLLSFLPGLEHDTTTENVRDAYKTVIWSRQEILREMSAAWTRVDELSDLIHEQNLTLLPFVTADPGVDESMSVVGDSEDPKNIRHDAWYWKGDILALQLGYIDALLDSRSIADAADFRKYLEPILLRAYKSRQHQACYEDDVELNRKTLRLFQALAGSSTSNALEHVLGMIVELMMLIANESDTIYVLPKSEEARSELDAFNALQPRRDPLADGRESLAVSFDDLLRNFTNFDLVDRHFNFVAARRQLWDNWHTDADCLTADLDDHERCFHQNLWDFLQLLHKGAHQEIRAKTYLAVGHHLPTELADVIAEGVIRAEELPLENDIYDAAGNLYEAYRCPWATYWSRFRRAEM